MIRQKNTTLGHKDGFEKQSGRTGGIVTGIGAVPRGPERLTMSPGCGKRTGYKTPQGVWQRTNLNRGDTKRAAELKGCRGARGPSGEAL